MLAREDYLPSGMTHVEMAPSVFKNKRASFNVDQVMDTLYHEAVIGYRGDASAAREHVDAMRDDVQALHGLLPRLRRGDSAAVNRAAEIFGEHHLPDQALHDFLNGQKVPNSALRDAGMRPVDVRPELVIENMIPAITGDDEAKAGRSLRTALKILRNKAGLEDPEPLYKWLSNNVSNDNVLYAAGIDAEAVREVGAAPDLHPDVAALLEAGRSMLDSIKGLRDAHVDDAVLASAGRTFEAFSGTGPSGPELGAVIDGVPLSSVAAVPVRV